MTERGEIGTGKKIIVKSHGKQHGGHKGKWINPLTAQLND